MIALLIIGLVTLVASCAAPPLLLVAIPCLLLFHRAYKRRFLAIREADRLRVLTAQAKLDAKAKKTRTAAIRYFN